METMFSMFTNANDIHTYRIIFLRFLCRSSSLDFNLLNCRNIHENIHCRAHLNACRYFKKSTHAVLIKEELLAGFLGHPAYKYRVKSKCIAKFQTDLAILWSFSFSFLNCEWWQVVISNSASILADCTTLNLKWGPRALHNQTEARKLFWNRIQQPQSMKFANCRAKCLKVTLPSRFFQWFAQPSDHLVCFLFSPGQGIWPAADAVDACRV